MATIKGFYFSVPADITAPGALEGVASRAQIFADTLYLEREGLPGNLSVHARRVVALAPLALTDPSMMAELMKSIGNINRLLAIWPTLKSHTAQTEKQKAYGAKGGRTAKLRVWAVEVANKLAKGNHATDDIAWLALPDSATAWEIETKHADFVVYAENDEVIAVDDASKKESKLKKSTFLKNYYRKAKRAESNPP